MKLDSVLLIVALFKPPRRGATNRTTLRTSADAAFLANAAGSTPPGPSSSGSTTYTLETPSSAADQVVSSVQSNEIAADREARRTSIPRSFEDPDDSTTGLPVAPVTRTGRSDIRVVSMSGPAAAAAPKLFLYLPDSIVNVSRATAGLLWGDLAGSTRHEVAMACPHSGGVA